MKKIIIKNNKEEYEKILNDTNKDNKSFYYICSLNIIQIKKN